MTMTLRQTIAWVKTWGEIRCPVCAGVWPCPPKGNIPHHPTGTGKDCKGGNTFPESPDWVTPPAETTSTPPPESKEQ